jgi:MPBQ/MSBQ methyltransferase
MNHPEQYWGRAGLAQAILRSLADAGKDLDSLTIDDLAPVDQFHGGGKASTIQLGVLASLRPGLKVLDVGGGLGGPARTLAAEYGCTVTVLDPTSSYLEVCDELTRRLGLDSQVQTKLGNALDIQFSDHSFDVVWTQNSGMNIEDKNQLYSEIYRVLEPDGVLAFQEPAAGNQPLVFPVMWAKYSSESFLLRPADLRVLIESQGFTLREWEDGTLNLPPRSAAVPQHSIQYLVMGEDVERISSASRQNEAEDRVTNVRAVFEKTAK